MDVKKRKIIEELMFNIVFLAVNMFFFIYSMRYSGIRDTTLGTGTFPRIILVLLMIFSVINLIRTAIRYMERHKKELKDIDEKQNSINIAVMKRFLLAFLLLIIYYMLIKFVGFVVPTIIFIILMMILLSQKVNRSIFIFSVLATIILYVSFRILLKVPLPTGFMGF